MSRAATPGGWTLTCEEIGAPLAAASLLALSASSVGSRHLSSSGGKRRSPRILRPSVEVTALARYRY